MITANIHVSKTTEIKPHLFPANPATGVWPFVSVTLSLKGTVAALMFRDVTDIERLVAELQAVGNWLANPPKEPSHVTETRDGVLRFDDAQDARFRLHQAGSCDGGCEFCERIADETPGATIAPGPDDVPAPSPTACALCGAPVNPGDRHCAACLANIPF